MLIVGSLAIAGFSSVYSVLRDYRILLTLVLAHGVFWSGLLSASSAYITDIIPPNRRAEGISYWSISNILAIAVAPQVGFAIYARGWGSVCAATAALNLAMAVIAWRLPPDVRLRPGTHHGPLIEWPVLILSITLVLYSFGYGGITSFVALYADANGVVPKSIFFTAFALTILVTRPVSGPLADRIGYRRVFLPLPGPDRGRPRPCCPGRQPPRDHQRRHRVRTPAWAGVPGVRRHVMQHVPDSRRGAGLRQHPGRVRHRHRHRLHHHRMDRAARGPQHRVRVRGGPRHLVHPSS
jgi:hypothetical protein